MDNEIFQRLEKIEKSIADKQKDFWEKVQVLTPILIPVTIALVGWYYTEQHFKNQLEIQQRADDNQLQISIVNSNVGQSELIGSLMEHLTSKDSSARRIAIEAILYAAPAPGKRIVDIIIKTSDTNTKSFAIDALSAKRNDLINNLFSTEKQNRIIAANEINSNWSTDSEIIPGLISKANECLNNKESSPDCENGLYNTVVVLNGFPKAFLASYKPEIINFINRIPNEYKQTLGLSREFQKKLD